MVATLRVEDVTKTFVTSRTFLGRPKERLTAVRSVSLEVGHSETVALVGESGSGKSTVGRLALRLLEPDSGTISVSGRDLSSLGKRELREIRAKARMIFQDPFLSLDPRLTVGRSVMEPLRLHTELDRDGRRARAEDLMSRVGMNPDHLDRYPHQFSGGQLQRVAIARAIATNPDLVVCDEPTAALDMSVRAQVVNLLGELQESLGLSYLFISHDLSLVRSIARRVLVMNHGEIVESGTVDEVFSEPKEDYTRALLASVPRIDATRRHQRLPKVVTQVTEDQPSPTRVKPELPAAPAEDGSPIAT